MHTGQVRLWNPHADYLPVDLFLIIIHVYKLSSLGTGRRTSCIRDEQTEAAAAHRSGHEFIHGEKSPSAQRAPRTSPLCLPREQTFMKTFPQNHYNSITIPSSLYLRHDCICCSADPPPNQASQPPTTHPHHHFLYPTDVTKQGEGECSALPLGDVERRLAAARFTPVLSVFVHRPLWGRGTAA